MLFIGLVDELCTDYDPVDSEEQTLDAFAAVKMESEVTPPTAPEKPVRSEPEVMKSEEPKEKVEINILFLPSFVIDL